MTHHSITPTLAPFIAQQASPPSGIDTGAAGNTSSTGQSGAQPLGPNGGAGGTAQPGSNPLILFAPLLLLFVVMIFMSSRAQKKQKRQQQQMIDSIGRHDRVETIGGIIGTVAEMRDTEIVIKVDESTNTKIHVSKSAIKGVLKQSRRDNASASNDA
ncbi:MAG: preprotein translocase subunit YajC [Phycisphaeraceae bacterium]|nr:preprotein translocase subunit YajC [Phycisphaerales bacterium]MCB9843008.1 preprotein translocase subunit YajC [Phycisphaeraceae bacterium]